MSRPFHSPQTAPTQDTFPNVRLFKKKKITIIYDFILVLASLFPKLTSYFLSRFRLYSKILQKQEQAWFVVYTYLQELSF